MKTETAVKLWYAAYALFALGICAALLILTLQ